MHVLQWVDIKTARLGQVSRCDGVLPLFRLRSGGQKIARDLLTEELIVGLVPIEGVDHIIPVKVGLRDRVIGGIARRVGVSCNVQPVARPTLSIIWGGEQSIHYFRKSIWRAVGEE